MTKVRQRIDLNILYRQHLSRSPPQLDNITPGQTIHRCNTRHIAMHGHFHVHIMLTRADTWGQLNIEVIDRFSPNSAPGVEECQNATDNGGSWLTNSALTTSLHAVYINCQFSHNQLYQWPTLTQYNNIPITGTMFIVLSSSGSSDWLECTTGPRSWRPTD